MTPRRRRQVVHLSVTIPAEDHAKLIAIAEEADATLADVVRELVNIATKSRSKSDRIRLRIAFDGSDNST